MVETDKEHIYDTLINPLMAQILAICHAHRIPMVAHFVIPSPTDPHLACTSALLSDEFLQVVPSKPHRQDLLAALSILKDGFIAYTRTLRRH